MSWHVDTAELHRYAAGALHGPPLWSVEAHLSRCPSCRHALPVGPDVDRVWQRVDAALDAPRPGLLERLVLRLGVPEHLARLLAATPALRLSWLAAVGSTLAVGVAASWFSEAVQAPLFLLAVVPLVAVAGIAAAYGPRVDPTYEIGLVAPFRTFRLVLLRAAAVLSVTVVLAGAASVAVPDVGLPALAWLAPALLLVLASLALSPTLGPVAAAGLTGTVWVATLLVTARLPAGTSVLFHPTTQLGMAGAAVCAAVVVAVVRLRFEIVRPSFDRTSRRLTP